MSQPLILVPGLTCTAALWAPQIAALAKHATVSVADHSSHDTMAGIARLILAHAPQRFALAGLSMGGYIAFEIMRQAPDRVTRLALLDTSAKPFDQTQTPGRQALVALARSEGMEAALRKLLPVFLHPAHLKDEALVATVLEMGRDTGPDTFERQQAALMSRPDSRPTLATIRCPTLVLTGAQDLLTPVAEHEAIATGIAGSKLVIIPDCGHLSTLEKPEAVNHALAAWLTA
jgi:pimeloyl-ACP methyl ester carboxylesterase